MTTPEQEYRLLADQAETDRRIAEEWAEEMSVAERAEAERICGEMSEEAFREWLENGGWDERDLYMSERANETRLHS